MRGNWRARGCLECGWRPSPRPYPVGTAYSAIPDWREEPSVIALLFGRRPELAQTATPGAQVWAAIVENA